MKLSNSFWIIRKDNLREEENFINKILIKAGIIYKNSSGIYTYLPLGLKILDKINKIIDEELTKVKASRLQFPSLVQENVFIASQRDELFGKDMYKVIDRNNKKYYLCPTHEELFSLVASSKINSYKDLHFILYQITNKFRDEIKTNKGIIRKKEFIMFDAYSFDTDEAGLDISYDNMYHAFKNIFRRIGIDTIVATSDPGKMGAYLSEEFHAIGPYGEDDIVKCTKCSYTSNIDIAEVTPIKRYKDKKIEKLRLINTPNVKNIDDVSNFFGVKDNEILKSLIYKVESTYKMILMCGSTSVNENKLRRALGTNNFRLATSEEIEKIGSLNGFIGPIKSTMEIIADNQVKYMSNFICGANKKDYHYKNVNIPFDFKVSRYTDLRQFDEECKCPKCASNIEMIKGLEIGNIFKIGTNFSKKLGVSYINEKNEKSYVHMGSYGIGLDRCIYALAQKYHDNKGLMFPSSVSPCEVSIVIANVLDNDCKNFAENLYEKLLKENIDVILDDRKETLGVKLAEMQLIGAPISIIVGKSINLGKVEFKIRSADELITVDKNKIIEKIKEIL